MKSKRKGSLNLSIFICCILVIIAQSVNNSSTFAMQMLNEIPIHIIEKAAFEPDDCLTEKIDNYFQRRAKKYAFNGTVLYAEKGKVVYKNAFGYADIKKKTPLTTNSPMNLASVSKPLTATAVLMLVEQEKINLEDTIQQYIPDFPYPGIKISSLLSQKSGLPEYMYFVDHHWENRHQTAYWEDVFEIMQCKIPDRYNKPNYKYNYINTNYVVLSKIIEAVSCKTFADYMEENIFHPLEMTNSFVYLRGITPKAENMTFGHDDRKRKIQESYLNGVAGDKGIYASVEDLFKFDQALYNNRLITKETRDMAFAPKHRWLSKHDNYGFGWRINEKADGKIVYHSGWWNGYRSHFIRMIDEEKTAIVLTNSTRGGFLRNTTLRELIEG